jgi:ribosome-associated protein
MEDDDFISKTRRKRQMTELQDVGAALVKLSPEQLARIDMPEELREAVLECRKFNKHEAIRRQMQYIGRIMRNIDAAPIAEQLSALQAPSRRQTALFHVAERWRDEIMGADDAIARFAAEFPGADVHRLRALAAAAREERRGTRAPRHARELFHLINNTVQQHARNP